MDFYSAHFIMYSTRKIKTKIIQNEMVSVASWVLFNTVELDS